ncbi:MAG: hypothetical protein GQ532_12180 [Methylomarinum sp.]|nr:hypothetical protein [Methylomarinum sp.]
MAQKTMTNVISEEATAYISLPFFLTALQLSPLHKGCDITSEVFPLLLDKGMHLYFCETIGLFDTLEIDNNTLKESLHRTDNLLLESETPRDSIFSQEFIKTNSGNKITLNNIHVGRSNVMQVYFSMKFDSFPWVQIPWAYSENDCMDYPMTDFNEKYQTRFDQPFWDNPNSIKPTDQASPLLLQLDRKLAVTQKQNITISVPNNQSLIDIPLSDLLNQNYLQSPDEFQRAFYIYVWITNLNNELDTLKPDDYRNDKKSYDNRVSSLNTKIAEINTYLLSLDSCGNEEKQDQTLLNSQSEPSNNRDIDKWLWETWLENGKLGGSAFFMHLKKYKGQKGSPILDHYTSGSHPSIKWRTANIEGQLYKKSIQNMVGGTFKKIPVKPES